MSASLSPPILDLLKKIAKFENIENYTLEINDGSSKGDGYLSKIVGVSLKSKSPSKDLHLILKIAPEFNTDMQNATFQREIYFYEKIVPAFRKFALQNKLDVLGSVARCLGTVADKGQECLAFENVKTLGYQMWQRQIPPTEDHIELVFTEYAKLHALSFAMRSKHPKEFQELVKNVELSSMGNKEDDPILKGFTAAFHKNAVKALKSNKDILAAFEDYWNNRRIDFASVDTFVLDEYSVVIHGDPWINNVLFKYEDKLNPNKPTSLKIVDFQMSKLSPPVFDLIVFFCTSCTGNNLPNCQKYLDTYYKSLSKNLDLFGLDVHILYPRKVFENQWAQYRMFGLYASLMFIKLLVTEDDETQDLSSISTDDRNDHMEKELKNQAAYDKRVFDLVSYMYENKWL